MTAPRWHWIAFTDVKTKPHLVAAKLRVHLLHDLAARAHDVDHKDKLCADYFMDCSGPIDTERPDETFKLAGLKITIPSEDCADFYHRMAKLSPREFNPRPRSHVRHAYFKVHAWNRCLVLGPQQFKDLFHQLSARLQDAERRAIIFYAERHPISTTLREAAARIHDVPLDKIPNLGGNKTDRFHLKPRGSA